jgi:hypothetical protein
VAKPIALDRTFAGASLLALVIGMSAAAAQTAMPLPGASAQATAADVLSGLRGTAPGTTSQSDLGGSETFGDPPPLGESEPPPDRSIVKDGDIDTDLEPAPADTEPPDADSAPSQDGDLGADGQPNEIIEAPEADAEEAPADASLPADLDPASADPEPSTAEPTEGPAGAEPDAAEDGGGLPGVEPSFRPAYADADENPYEPLGIRVGSFLVFPEVTLEQAFDDNVLRTGAEPISDRILALRPSLRITSDWNRHSLEADLSALLSRHQKLGSEDDRALDAALRGRLDVTSDTILDAALGYQLSQESRGSIDFPDAATSRPDVTTRTASLALTQRFNRLAVRLRGVLTDSDRSGEGLDASEDFLERELGLRIGYEVSPGLYLFAEQELSRRTYGAPAADDGLLRDSDGRTTRVGVAAEITAKIAGELSIGKLVETPDADALASIEGLVADGSLTWTPSALTTVTADFRSSIAPTTLAGSAGALERSADLKVRHEFRRTLAAIAGLGATARDFAGTAIEEDELNARIGLEYLISREWVVGAGYERTEHWSSEPGADYSDNLFRISGTLRR